MVSLQQLRQFFLKVSLAVFFITAIAFGVGSGESWATVSSPQVMQPQPVQIANMNRGKAMTKEMEGKAQETMGNMTGDPKDQMMGKAKQVEGRMRNSTEDMKASLELKGRPKAVSKNIEGKVQEAKGKMTGDIGDQAAGKAKQAESQARNAVEDIKDIVRDILN
ncbi:MAG: hypothetical protein RLZZ490_1779 [Cyanobacteriota bacterium]